MKPFLICLDLDGTLLNDDKEISPYTKEVLKTLQAQGHKRLCPCACNVFSTSFV